MKAWIPTEEFIKKHGGDSKQIHHRVADGTWARGVIYSKPGLTGTGYIHEERALEWLAQQKVKPKAS